MVDVRGYTGHGGGTRRLHQNTPHSVFLRGRNRIDWYLSLQKITANDNFAPSGYAIAA